MASPVISEAEFILAVSEDKRMFEIDEKEADKEDGELVEDTPDIITDKENNMPDNKESPFMPAHQHLDPVLKSTQQEQGWELRNGKFHCRVKTCEKDFSQFDALRRHWLSAHKRVATFFMCPEDDCSYKSSRVYDVTRHLRTSHQVSLNEAKNKQSRKYEVEKERNKSYMSPGDLASPHWMLSEQMKSAFKRQHPSSQKIHDEKK
mgnify:CR=1 FL=1